MANDNQIAFLCSRLKELREKNGCTMDDMAKKIDVLEGLKPGTGMNKSSISRVEGGKTAEKTLLEMARKYCKVFGMSESQTEQFLRGEKVAVPDTSALLKNSQLIDELNKEYSKVVIPKVVVDELDNIKNKNSGSLGRKAWEVIRGISYGSRTILMEYNGDADEDNEDCKIIYIAQEASDTYHCKIDIITEDTDYSAYLKGHESVSALHLREYMATKQDLINMTKLARIDAYYADSYEECEEPTADEVNAYLQDGNTLIISAVRNNRATIEQRKEKIKFYRILKGGQMTMTVGFIAVIIQFAIGILVGGISGYYGGTVDILLMRLAEVVGSLPFIPLALILSALIGNKVSDVGRIIMIMLILGFLGWTGIAGLVRAQVLAERNKEFVVAAKALGVREKNIIFRHIVPNVMTIIIVQATISFATCMLTESGLSFLGFGVAEPIPSWGNMLNNCRSSEVISQYWWRWVFPSVVLGLCTVSINLFGDGLRRAVDPKANER